MSATLSHPYENRRTNRASNNSQPSVLNIGPVLSIDGASPSLLVASGLLGLCMVLRGVWPGHTTQEQRVMEWLVALERAARSFVMHSAAHGGERRATAWGRGDGRGAMNDESLACRPVRPLSALAPNPPCCLSSSPTLSVQVSERRAEFESAPCMQPPSITRRSWSHSEREKNKKARKCVALYANEWNTRGRGQRRSSQRAREGQRERSDLLHFCAAACC